MERFDSLEKHLEKPDEQKKALTIDGEKLFDNQDICFMFHICKRTLQRYRTLGWLPFLKIDQKAYPELRFLILCVYAIGFLLCQLLVWGRLLHISSKPYISHD
jgi:hypothetical protein